MGLNRVKSKKGSWIKIGGAEGYGKKALLTSRRKSALTRRWNARKTHGPHPNCPRKKRKNPTPPERRVEVGEQEGGKTPVKKLFL